jgi:ABC-2 type transport system ATP-binding protein
MELTIKNLSKTYPNGVKALDNVSLTIPQGMFGLLGPNGAGKSSLMRTIATLQAPDSGSIHLDAIDALHDQLALRRVLGYLPQEFGVYPRVSAEDLLDHMAVVKGVVHRAERRELVAALLEQTNLYEVRKRSISTFSGGMKQRFGIAQALIGQPLLIIVDEPTAGLDPGERNRFYNLLSEIGEHIIVILSTHIVDDVRELCANMAIINQGRVLYTGRPQQAIDALQGRIWERTIEKAELAQYEQDYAVISTKLLAGQPLLHVYGEALMPTGFQAVAPSLEDVFFTTLQEKNRPSVALPA